MPRKYYRAEIVFDLAPEVTNDENAQQNLDAIVGLLSDSELAFNIQGEASEVEE